MFQLNYLSGSEDLQNTCEKLIEQIVQGAPWKVKTSGSTGKPKTITHSQEVIAASANATNAYFDLNEHTKALLSLSLETIGGKMMLARAYHGNYELFINTAQANPLQNLEFEVDFTTVVPTQMQSILDAKQNARCKKYLLGGAAVSADLEQKLKTLPESYYHSFGMSETASHVAVRKIGERPAIFSAISGVTFSTQDDQLVIHAPALHQPELKTNDLVELLNEHQFIWKGRADFVVNSGGFKILPELLEERLAKSISEPFFLIGEADEKWGERLVLYIESEENPVYPWEQIKAEFKAHEWPKEIYICKEFKRSESGKILRKASTLEPKKNT